MRTKKHPCADCRQCQWCSDDRCRLCLKPCSRKKRSIAEQIALYEQLNRGETPEGETAANDRGTLPDEDTRYS